MSFLTHLKSAVFDTRRGNREQVTVNRSALLDLLYHFDRLDTEARAQIDTRDLNENLHHAIEAVYKNNDCSEKTLLIVMDTLGPLIRERLKENDLKGMFRI